MSDESEKIFVASNEADQLFVKQFLTEITDLIETSNVYASIMKQITALPVVGRKSRSGSKKSSRSQALTDVIRARFVIFKELDIVVLQEKMMLNTPAESPFYDFLQTYRKYKANQELLSKHRVNGGVNIKKAFSALAVLLTLVPNYALNLVSNLTFDTVVKDVYNSNASSLFSLRRNTKGTCVWNAKSFLSSPSLQQKYKESYVKKYEEQIQKFYHMPAHEVKLAVKRGDSLPEAPTMGVKLGNMILTSVITLDSRIKDLQMQTKHVLGAEISGMMIFTMQYEYVNAKGEINAHAFVMASDVNDQSKACLIEPNDLKEKWAFRGFTCTQNIGAPRQYKYPKEDGATTALELLALYMKRFDMPPNTTFFIENAADTMITITNIEEIYESFESSKRIADELLDAFDFSTKDPTGAPGLYSGGKRIKNTNRIKRGKTRRL